VCDPVSPDLQAVGHARDLMKILCKRAMLFQAWRKVRENGLHSLSDETRQEISQFDAIAASQLDRIQYHLSHHRFEFRPQKGIPKRRPGKQARPLVIAAIENRVVQRAILDVLQDLPQIRDVLAIKTSIGGIKDRGREHAMALIRGATDAGASYFIRSDIEGFFTQIPRALVLDFIAHFVNDQEFMELLGRATDTNLANLHQLGDDALLFPIDDLGVAQGSPLSPLIGNILLRGFDREMNGRGVSCIRYIDDFLLLGPNERGLQKAFAHAQQLLSGFGLHAYEPGADAKAEAGRVQDGFDFLGCAISPGLIQPARPARQKILAQIDAILAEGRRSIAASRTAEPSSIPKQRYAQTLGRIDRVVRGWGHAYAFCDGRQSFDSIDKRVDARISPFLRQVELLLARVPPAIARRVLGVHLLADTPIVPLPIG
jgi:retron-type reverse transcriptase